MAPPKKASTKKKGRARSARKRSDEKQSERFKKMAREVGVDETGSRFGLLLDLVLPKKTRH